jgi:aminodeoxyfutalosine synthase
MSLTAKLIPPQFRTVYDKVLEGGRITEDEALQLYRSRNLNVLGAIANVVRERKNGNIATYIHNQYINYSNVCVLSCQFCAFGARKRDPHAFEFTIDQIETKAKHALSMGITEIHMVGGLHPTLKPEWYIELLQRLRALDPNVFLKAFTAIEIRHLADRIFKKPIRETLEILRSHGLGALTGGGAEIFDQGVRDQICRGKETAAEWCEVHRIWHGMGMPSTATMLFGHVETLEHRVDHLRQLRELQDETRGFTGFVPFSCVPETTALSHLKPATVLEELCNLAVCRIYLDNFDHITAYWVSLGLASAALALNYGVDDLHGTIMEENIFHMAGATTPTSQRASDLERAIREAGREPAQRDTYYRRITPTWKKPAGSAAASGSPSAELVCA